MGILDQALIRSSKVVSPWVSVNDSLPKDERMVLVYTAGTGDRPEYLDFDFYQDGCWILHQDQYDHYIMVGGPKLGPGPTEYAPYTHWMYIPTFPGEEDYEPQAD